MHQDSKIHAPIDEHTLRCCCKTCDAYILDYFAEEAFERYEEYKIQAIFFIAAAVVAMVPPVFFYIIAVAIGVVVVALFVVLCAWPASRAIHTEGRPAS